MSVNGMPVYGKTPRYVKLSSLPTPNTEQAASFSDLSGGLNTSREEYLLSNNESPDIVNLKWENGSVCARPGQEWVDSVSTRGETFASYPTPFAGSMFYHIGDGVYALSTTTHEVSKVCSLGALYHGDTVETTEVRKIIHSNAVDPGDPDYLITTYRVFTPGAVEVSGVTAMWEGGEQAVSYTTIRSGDGEMYVALSGISESTHPCVGDSFEIELSVRPQSGGCFFLYHGSLFYKAPGVFIRIASNLAVTDVLSEAYVPITYLNMDALTHAGDAYQPENRLSSSKIIWYNAPVVDTQVSVTTTTSTDYSFSGVKVSEVYLDSTKLTEGVEYTIDWTTPKIVLRTAPTAGQILAYTLGTPGLDYYLPVSGIGLTVPSISAIMTSSMTYSTLTGQSVGTDPTAWNPDWNSYDYVYHPASGHILFKTAAYVSRPFTNNTVRVTYTLANPDAEKSIMGCHSAIVFGGSRDICVVLAGSSAQSNAYYWNGNSNVGMDAAYWPMNQYNLAGDDSDAISGFGKQQSLLVIFKERSVGRASLDTTTLDDRETLTLDYTPINAETGCDLPKTIQLVSNNLVWCNTRGGVYYLKDSSSAYENNVVCISSKINRDLLIAVRKDPDTVSFDDGQYYWLVSRGKAWLWYYAGTERDDPSWFYYTGIGAKAMSMDEERRIYHADNYGRISKFGDRYTDYDRPYLKRYTFPPSFLGSVERYKDVTRAVFVLRNKAPSTVTAKYFTDFETRSDDTPMTSDVWSLTPRDLSGRDLSATPWERSFARRPNCKAVRHLKLVLEAEGAGDDLSIVMVQVFYKLRGRLK